MATNIVQMTDGTGNKQYPVTSAEAVGMPDGSGNLTNYLDKRVTEYNVSVLHPTSGSGGSNKYTLETAIAQVPSKYRSVGIKCAFINESGKPECWKYQGGSWVVGSFVPVEVINELNISFLYPTNGVGGTNKYDLATAITRVPLEYRTIVGLKITFINNDTTLAETWVYNGGVFTNINTWSESNDSEKIIEVENESLQSVSAVLNGGVVANLISSKHTYIDGYTNTVSVSYNSMRWNKNSYVEEDSELYGITVTFETVPSDVKIYAINMSGLSANGRLLDTVYPDNSGEKTQYLLLKKTASVNKGEYIGIITNSVKYRTSDSGRNDGYLCQFSSSDLSNGTARLVNIELDYIISLKKRSEIQGLNSLSKQIENIKSDIVNITKITEEISKPFNITSLFLQYYKPLNDGNLVYNTDSGIFTFDVRNLNVDSLIKIKRDIAVDGVQYLWYRKYPINPLYPTTFITDEYIIGKISEVSESLDEEVTIPQDVEALVIQTVSNNSVEVSTNVNIIDELKQCDIDINNQVTVLSEGGNLAKVVSTILSFKVDEYVNVLPTNTSNGNLYANNSSLVLEDGTLNSVSIALETTTADIDVYIYAINQIKQQVRLLGAFKTVGLEVETFELSNANVYSGEYIALESKSKIKYKGTGGLYYGKKFRVVKGELQINETGNFNGELYYTISLNSFVNFTGLSKLNDEVLSNKNRIESLEISLNHPYVLLQEDNLTSDNGNWEFGNESWNYSVEGVTPKNYGAEYYARNKKVYHSDRRFMRVRVKLGSDSFFRIPCSYGTGINSGEGASCFGVDMSNKKLIIYASTNPLDTQYSAVGYDLNNELDTTEIPTKMIGNREYIVELHKFGTTSTLILLDTLTGQKVSVSHDGWGCGRQNELYGFYAVRGTMPIFQKFEVYSFDNPDIVFVGDSITEGVYVYDRTQRYAELFRTTNPDKCVVISARGGDTIDGILKKFDTEYNIYKPKLMSVLIGENGGNTPEKLQQLIDKCSAINCDIIIHRRSCTNRLSAEDLITSNNQIADTGKNGARFDIATALNNDPSQGANPELLGEGDVPTACHPNIQGQREMYNRLLIDTPEMYYNIKSLDYNKILSNLGNLE